MHFWLVPGTQSHGDGAGTVVTSEFISEFISTDGQDSSRRDGKNYVYVRCTALLDTKKNYVLIYDMKNYVLISPGVVCACTSAPVRSLWFPSRALPHVWSTASTLFPPHCTSSVSTLPFPSPRMHEARTPERKRLPSTRGGFGVLGSKARRASLAPLHVAC